MVMTYEEACKQSRNVLGRSAPVSLWHAAAYGGRWHCVGDYRHLHKEKAEGQQGGISGKRHAQERKH